MLRARSAARVDAWTAVLEGIALQNRDILDAMVKDAGEMRSLKVDGGASANTSARWPPRYRRTMSRIYATPGEF